MNAPPPPILAITCISPKIGPLEFALQGDFSEGYTNNLKAAFETKRTHPPKWLWEKGEIDDLELELSLAVGASLDIDTPQDLLGVITKLYNMCLGTSIAAQAEQGAKIPKVIVSIGAWYQRYGFIKNFKVKFSPPWDVATRLPMIATVNLTITADFSTGNAQTSADVSILPKPPDWDFSKQGTQ